MEDSSELPGHCQMRFLARGTLAGLALSTAASAANRSARSPIVLKVA